MPTTDIRGHKVPLATDLASRQSLLDLSLSIGDIKTVTSQTAAQTYVNSLKSAGVSISADSPVYVNVDGVLRAWNGVSWADVGDGLARTQITEVRGAGLLDVRMPGYHVGGTRTERGDRPLRVITGQTVQTSDAAGQIRVNYGITLTTVVCAMAISADWNAAVHCAIQSASGTSCVISCMEQDGSARRSKAARVNFLIIGW